MMSIVVDIATIAIHYISGFQGGYKDILENPSSMQATFATVELHP